jgi:hypothetical protein
MRDLAKLREAELPLRREADGLPGDVLNEAAAHLRRPFTAAAVKWKLQATWAAGTRNAGGIVIPFIDARLVVERLNAVVPGLWWDEYAPGGGKALECALTVDGITRRDVGTAGATEPEKAIRSDALKRAAVKFGVGASIYAMKQVKLSVHSGPELARLVERTKGQGQSAKTLIELPDSARLWLADKYDEWLEARGEAMFGPVLDHGDEPGSAGADEDLGVPEAEPAGEVGLPALDDEEARALNSAIEEAYARLRTFDPMALLPAAFNRKLAEASTSHRDLAALLSEIDGLAQQRADAVAADA